MKQARFDHAPDAASQWALRVSIAVVFTITGLEKFDANPASYWIHTFDAIGLGQWFRYFTGVWEVIGGLLFLIPAATMIGFSMLACAMVGAMMVQAFVLQHPGYSLFPAAYLLAAAGVFAKVRVVPNK